jgi:hypothetical protein
MTRLALTERVRASPYYPAVVHPVFRRVLPGAAASALGDGMSAVAIAWLALKLAPASSRGLWVGAAIAAYTLPGAVGAIALRRRLSGRHGTGLVIVNAVLRCAALGLVGCLGFSSLSGDTSHSDHPVTLRADQPDQDKKRSLSDHCV